MRRRPHGAPGPPRHGLLRTLRRSRHVEANGRPRSGNLSDPRDPFAQLRALSAEHVDENGTHGSARRPCTGFQMAGCAARGMHDRRVVTVGEDDVFPGWELPENIRIDTSATAAIASTMVAPSPWVRRSRGVHADGGPGLDLLAPALPRLARTLFRGHNRAFSSLPVANRLPAAQPAAVPAWLRSAVLPQTRPRGPTPRPRASSQRVARRRHGSVHGDPQSFPRFASTR